MVSWLYVFVLHLQFASALRVGGLCLSPSYPFPGINCCFGAFCCPFVVPCPFQYDWVECPSGQWCCGYFYHICCSACCLFICVNLWIHDPDATALVHALRRDSSLMTCAMIFCSSYLVISSIDVRYWDARSWYNVGREEQNMNVVMSSDILEWLFAKIRVKFSWKAWIWGSNRD